MKIFYKWIFLVLLISCRTNRDITEYLNNYKKGIEILGIIDSSGDVNLSEALNYFNRSVKENPEHVESKYWKMSCELQMGKLDDALQTSKSVIDNPINTKHRLTPHFFVTAGLVEKINGNTDKSLEYFRSANEDYEKRLRKDPNDIDAILNKATTLCYMDKKDEAIKFLDSLKANRKNQAMLEQVRVSIAEFEVHKIISDLIQNEN